MKKINDIAKLFVLSESLMKCQKCGQSFKFSINENVYIRLDRGHFNFKCPHCEAEHIINLDISLEKEENNGLEG